MYSRMNSQHLYIYICTRNNQGHLKMHERVIILLNPLPASDTSAVILYYFLAALGSCLPRWITRNTGEYEQWC